MSSAFVPQGAYARNGSLTASWLDQLYRNQRINQAVILQEHNTDGSHNALEVPTVIGTVTQSGGAYSLDTGASIGIAGVTKLGTGLVSVQLSTALPSGLVPPVIIQVLDSPTALRPYAANWTLVDTTHIAVQLSFLSVALSTTDTWAAVDAGFCIKVYTLPVALNSPPLLPLAINSVSPLEYDNGGGQGFNELITNAGAEQANLLSGHTALGAHNIRQVPREYAVVKFVSGSATLLYASPGVSGISKFSTGHYELSLSPNMSGDYQVFTNCLNSAQPY